MPPESEPSPLGKRQWSGAADATAVGVRSEAETYADTRDKIVSIATALAFSVEESDRDRLINKLTATLHPKPKADPAAAAARPKESAYRHSPLSEEHLTGDDPPQYPTVTISARVYRYPNYILLNVFWPSFQSLTRAAG